MVCKYCMEKNTFVDTKKGSEKINGKYEETYLIYVHFVHCSDNIYVYT